MTPNPAIITLLADPTLRAGDDTALPIPASPYIDAIFRGGAVQDTLYGGISHDLLIGGSENDFLGGEAGDDILLGGSGNDTLFGGSGNNFLVGGAGNDVFVFNAHFLAHELGDWDGDGAMDDYRVERFFFNFQPGNFSITSETDFILDYEASDSMEFNSRSDGGGVDNAGLRAEGYMPAGGVSEIPADILRLLKAIQDNDPRQFGINFKELVKDLRATDSLDLLNGLGSFLKNFDQVSQSNFFKNFDWVFDRFPLLDGSKLLSSVNQLLEINFSQPPQLEAAARFVAQFNQVLGYYPTALGSANLQAFLNATLVPNSGTEKFRDEFTSSLEKSGVNGSGKFFVNSFLSDRTHSTDGLVASLNSSEIFSQNRFLKPLF